MQPTPLVFIHIHKTAGTSLIDWLQRGFPLNHTLYEGSDLETLGRARLSRLCQSRFIRGHFGCGALNYLPPHREVVLLLRDPVDRVISHYYHHLDDTTDAYHSLIAGDPPTTLEQYIRHPCYVEFVDNLQTRELGVPGTIGKGVYRPLFSDLTESEKVKAFDRAMRLVDHAVAVGVTEQLDLFLRLMCATFPLLYDATLPTRRRRISNLTVTRAIRDEIAERNKYDCRLHAYAKERMEHLLRDRAVVQASPDQCAWQVLSPVYYRHLLEQPERSFFDWSAGSGTVAQGWQEVVPAARNREHAAHWWSGPSERSVIHTMLSPDTRYRIEVRIMRFVSALPRLSLRLELNGLPVVLNQDRRLRSRNSGHWFAGETDVVPAALSHPGVWITFFNDVLQTFSEVNPLDRDTRPRGFAIHSIRVRPLAS